MKAPLFTPSKKVRRQPSADNEMPPGFWNSKGIVFIDYKKASEYDQEKHNHTLQINPCHREEESRINNKRTTTLERTAA